MFDKGMTSYKNLQKPWVPSLDEMRRFINNADGIYKLLFKLLFYTGVRVHGTIFKMEANRF